MRVMSVATRTCASCARRRSEVSPAGVACQPVRSIVPSAATSAAITMLPVMPASGRPFASTIGPRGPIRSTVRYACPTASDVYCGPCRIWIDHARRTSTQMPTPTSAASPPTRTKKPGLRKNGASTREYGCTRRRGKGRASFARRRGSGVEIATASAAGRTTSASSSVGADSATRGLLLGELVREEREREAAPREVAVAREGGDAGRHALEAVRVELGKRPLQGFSPLGRVELGAEPVGGDRVEAEPAGRVAARRAHGHRRARRAVQLVRGARDGREAEPADRHEQAGRGGREARRFEPFQLAPGPEGA